MVRNPLLSILVVSYNTREMTLACLRSVFAETVVTECEILVLDNASTDGSADAMREEFGGRIVLTASEVSVGFAAGNNQIAARATGKYLLLLNPDTVVLDGAIDRIMAFARQYPAAGIWGGRNLDGERKLDPTSCWARQTVWSLFCRASGLAALFQHSNLFNPEGMGGWNRDGIRYVDVVTGCFLLIRTDLWRALEGFREIFFMYGEEADLCLRARAIGARPLVTSQAAIVHYGGASERIRADKLVRLLKAKMLLVQLHFSPATRPVGAWLIRLWPRTRYVARAVLASLGHSPSAGHRDVWKEVLMRRAEWAWPVMDSTSRVAR